jgi:DNA-binding HxlR family transcriptional regulator
MSELEVVGFGCLDLLGDEATVSLLVQLRAQALSASEIQEAGSGVGYRVALSRLRELLGLGLVDIEGGNRSDGGAPRRAHHRLTVAGEAIHAVIDAAAKCEAEWLGQTMPLGPPGTKALAVASDRRSRAILRLLVEKRLRAMDIDRSVGKLSHGTVQRHLRDLEKLGLVERGRVGRETWHDLTVAARRLASITIRAARWEWAFGGRDRRGLASDLAGFICQVAPLARMPEEVQGICVLHEEWPITTQGDIYLVVRRGRITPHCLDQLASRDAEATAAPQQWAQALLTGDPSEIACSGDHSLIEAVIVGLNREILT